MAKQPTMTITCSLPWWFKCYIFGLAAFCVIFRTEIDKDKFEAMVLKSIKYKVEVK